MLGGMSLYAAEAFAGGGLLSLALTVEGIEVGEVCEFDKVKAETLRMNFSHAEVAPDARTWTPRVPPGGIDLLCGGPPCQPWSGAGSQLGPDDPRDMWPQVIRWAREVRPRLILMENNGTDAASRKRAGAGLKPGILDDKFRDYVTSWWAAMNEVGYEGVIWTCLAADYGTPQLRPRVVFVAWPHASPLAETLRQPPPITHARPEEAEQLGLLPWVSGYRRLISGCCAGHHLYTCVWLNNADRNCEDCYAGSNYVEAGGDRDEELSAEAIAYVMRDPTRIRKHKPIDMSGTYDRGLAPTMTANLRKGAPYGLVIEPGGLVADFTDERDYQFLRRITAREAAKLQDVPQWYDFAGSLNQQLWQIGNGIPINLGRAIARHVLRAFGAPLLPEHQIGSGLWPIGRQPPNCGFTRAQVLRLRGDT
jgi:site-specific DNA-cytosine methylase